MVCDHSWEKYLNVEIAAILVVRKHYRHRWYRTGNLCLEIIEYH